jgi:formate dehydrogenase subunit beta
MGYQWSLDTSGDPLGKVRSVIKEAWTVSGLDGMLVTLYGAAETHAQPRLVTEIEAIDQVNPFRPLMQVNAARLLPDILAAHPNSRIGAVLRPCEMRALVEMTKHTALDLDRLLTISVDCLGTLPANEFQWRLERIQKGLPTEETPDELAQEALNFARQGGILPYRFRSACQVCSSPSAKNADITIHILGLPVRQKILVSARETKKLPMIQPGCFPDAEFDEELVEQHERVLARMVERHNRHMERLNHALGSLLPADVGAVLRHLETCGDCQNCMDVCPICSVNRPKRDAHGRYDPTSVTQWLISCAGCGMCEQSCPKELPTAAIFAAIRRQLGQLFDYSAGRSLDEPLPLL